MKRRYKCPLCESHLGFVRRENLCVYPVTGTFFCFRCRRYGKLSWLKTHSSLDLSEVVDQEETLEDKNLDFDFCRLFDWGKDNPQRWLALDYLRKRKLDDEAIEKSFAGVSSNPKYENRVVFPILEKDNTFQGFIARSLRVDSYVPYLIDKGVHKASIFYNGSLLSKELDRVYITEGIFDALRVGLDWAVASLGKDLSEQQIDRVYKAKPKKIIFLMDGDAWQLGESYAQIASVLTKEDKFFWAKCPAGRDPADIGRKAVEMLEIHKPF